MSEALDIFKGGGEGSRGGKVIAHTSSGKPVYAKKYESGQHFAISHNDFSANDHYEAAHHHMVAGKGGESTYHGQMMQAHMQMANAKGKGTSKKDDPRFGASMADYHVQESKKSEDFDLSKAGVGSRGGKVIGHTKTGKPIYESGHAKSVGAWQAQHKGWTHHDHNDAADAHYSRSEHHHDKSEKHDTSSDKWEHHNHQGLYHSSVQTMHEHAADTKEAASQGKNAPRNKSAMQNAHSSAKNFSKSEVDVLDLFKGPHPITQEPGTYQLKGVLYKSQAPPAIQTRSRPTGMAPAPSGEEMIPLENDQVNQPVRLAGRMMDPRTGLAKE